MEKRQPSGAAVKAVVQRVSSSRVFVEGECVGSIGHGLNILLGVTKTDTRSDADKLLNKIIALRIFHDENKKMNLSLKDVDGSLLVISQFTLVGNVKKGRRPSFDESAPPEQAKALYDYFVEKGRAHGIEAQTGIFGAMMEVEIHNDGPVTFVIDSEILA